LRAACGRATATTDVDDAQSLYLLIRGEYALAQHGWGYLLAIVAAGRETPTMRLPGRALTFGFVVALAVVTPAAAASTTTVSDPLNDTAMIAGPGSTPAYLDIVSAAVSKEVNSFAFSIGVAVTPPEQPILPPQVKEAWWFWPIDTDPTTSPTGFPRGPGLAFPPEFLLAVTWNGTRYSAFLIDRGPTLTGGDHVITPVPFTVENATVTAVVDAALLDDPTAFRFSAYTRVWLGGPGTEGFLFTDVAGLPGVFHPWVA
jgi:hypothetical protein